MNENTIKNMQFEQAFIAIANHTDITGETQQHIFLVDRNGGGLLVAQLVHEPRPVTLEGLAPTNSILSVLPAAIALAKDPIALQTNADRTAIEGFFKDIRFGLEKLRKLDNDPTLSESLQPEVAYLLDEAEYVLECCTTYTSVSRGYKAFSESYIKLMDEVTKAAVARVRQQTIDKVLAQNPDATEDEKRAVYELMGVPYPEPAAGDVTEPAAPTE